jgi:hypothetical protein
MGGLRPDRRSVILGAAGLAGACAATPPGGGGEALLDDLEQRTFRFFWDTTDTEKGLAHDRWPTQSFSSVAAVGFALTAYPIGVERGWAPRAEAARRTLNTLRFFHDAPQGPQASGVTGHKGFFYHFLDRATGTRFEQTELSTVDTALFLGGSMFAAGYFDRQTPVETEIRRLADAIYARVDWRWAQTRPPSIALGWHPEKGFLPYDWIGYSEAMLIYLMALGSPTHAIEPAAWTRWTSGYDQRWGEHWGQTHLHFGPLFGHQYSHVWIDFRGIRDPWMAAKGIDYFENSRRATLAQRAYAVANPMRWRGYDGQVWGLTACDGPADVKRMFAGEMREFRSYSARGPGDFDDGTIAPTAAAASIAFAPEIVIPAIAEMRRRHPHVYGRYGFLDSFNPSFTYTDTPLKHGRLVAGQGWVDTDYLGIDQGPILAMVENHRSDLVWRVMRRNPHLRRGLQRAGFTGGWLAAAA